VSADSLLIYPDPRLRRVAEPVTRFDATLSEAVGELEAVMQAASALGLTLPHIGWPLRRRPT
jgi:peptide deformylase